MGLRIDLAKYHGLVMHLARQADQRLPKADRVLDLDDLIQEGMIGLLRAARSYISQTEAQFSTFAYLHISGAIRDALRHLDPLSQEKRYRVREMETIRGQLAQAYSKEPLESELAAWLDLSAAEAHHLAFLGQIREIRSGLGVGLELTVDAGQERDLVRQLLGEEVQAGLAEVLDPTERQVLVLRFWAGLALKKVGVVMGKPLQTVYRIEVRARCKLKAWLEAREWEVADILCGLEAGERTGG